MRAILLGGCLLFVVACQCGPSSDADAGAGHASAADAAVGDAGAGDAGSSDVGSDDAGSGDAGSGDAGSDDAGSSDASVACEDVTWAAPPGCTATDLEGRLGCVPHLRWSRAANPPAGYTQYALFFTQPVDHLDPDAGSFEQRATLLLASETAPVVLYTSGYGLPSGVSEVAKTFGANQLSYEHRYFAASRPVPTDWSHLTIAQAAADAHELVKALRWLFPGRWVNSGASKGGMTSVYHRRFHSCDVDATVAYVAPVSYGPTDPSYGPFIAAVGGAPWAQCRADLTRFQRQLLGARDRLVLFLASGTYNRIGGPDRALELAIVDFPFAFWQYTSPDDALHGCGAIPPSSATETEMMDFLLYHSDPQFLASDGILEYFEPYYYQAATQLGGPGPYEAPVADLLAYPGLDVAATYAPTGVPLTFDDSAMADVNQWLDRHGERVMLVYGAFDPWSTHQIPLGGASDSFTFVVEGGNHSARLGLLAPADREAALATLERWLGRARVNTPHLLPEQDDTELRAPR